MKIKMQVIEDSALEKNTGLEVFTDLEKEEENIETISFKNKFILKYFL